MYLKIGDDEYADSSLGLLSELLTILDEKVTEVNRLIAHSTDPESDGLTERGEYFIGVGLSAIQQYLMDTLTLTGIEKNCAFNLGPQYSHKLTFVAVVNAAANWWKHSAEWKWQDQEQQNKLAQRTQETVLEVVVDKEGLWYPLSNVLAALQGTHEVTLSALLPNLVLWRSAVEAKKGKQNCPPL